MGEAEVVVGEIGVAVVECTHEVGWRMMRVVSLTDSQDHSSVLHGEAEEEGDCECTQQCVF